MPDTRRSFLRKSALIAGTALAGAGLTRSGAAAPLEIPPTAQQPGRPIPPTGYGVPSKFETHVVRRRTDVLVNRQNWSDWSMTPLQHQHGIVTPNGLIFERHHAGIPDIDPATHKLVIHGMVKQSLLFGMDDLMRYPSVSKFNFIECSGNTLTDWTKAASITVQQTHGLLSGAQ
jgi:sulfane dehydrogenase subunit SoxC